ncbi:GNAT family N-acetyltransferase [Roseateles sp. LYH14W]|uniref:GNAT family N-acetyltransferase n=1 Tax=Pelomonas parva TaxID=3299032 RepID=A0ABW7F438_9BURK
MNAGQPLSLTTHDDPPPEPCRVVDAGLGEANDKAAPLDEVLPLATFAHLPSGEVVGGAIGRTWGACCELQQLWVHDGYRRRGLGRQLLQAFEARAEARGCQTIYLETFSFQAPAFYRALGYDVALELAGFAPGIVKYTMVRRALSVSPPSPA